MNDVVKVIRELRETLKKHKASGLNEAATRHIYIDPMLSALGWDLDDTDEVDLEPPTWDGKRVDYVMKINHKPELFWEAKTLNDPLRAHKAITQVLNYTNTSNRRWCALTNGRLYKVYDASENAAPPERLLFEVSIDPHDPECLPDEEIATKLGLLSKESVAAKALDTLATKIFPARKVRNALGRLFKNPPTPLIHLIKEGVDDNSVTELQIRQALKWTDPVEVATSDGGSPPPTATEGLSKGGASSEYTEDHHTQGMPSGVIEAYHGLDGMCQGLAPGRTTRAFTAKYVAWYFEKKIFCCARLQQGGLRVWVKTDPKALDPSESFARDVSKVGHYGVGHVELAIGSLEQLRLAAKFVRASFNGVVQQQKE